MITVAEARKLAAGKGERESLIRNRIQAGIRHWDPYKRRVDQLTRLALGDWSAFGGASMGDAHPETKGKAFEPSGLRGDYQQGSFEEAVSNEIQTQFWALVTGTAYRLPEIGFEGLEPLEAAVNSEYLKSIFRPEGKLWTADTAMTFALGQRVIGGLGWVAVLFRDGAPYLKPLDVVSEIVWDTKARHPEEATWAAQCVSAPLSEWAEMFDGLPGAKGHWDDLLSGCGRDYAIALDDEVEMIEYWSLSGEHAWLRVDKLSSDDPFLVLEESPWFVMTPEGKQAFLPVVPHRHLQIPRARSPHSLVEAMAPHQKALKGHEEALNHLVEKMKPYWDVEEGTYNEEELDKLGKQASVIQRKGTNPPATLMKGGEVSSSLLQAYEMAKSSLVSKGGGNPYAMGQQVDVRFSRQVEAIQENAGLMSSAVAEGYAKHWMDVSYYTLALGKVYDERPMELKLEEVMLQFGEEDPIGNLLRLTPDVVVSADSSQWKDDGAEINRWFQLLNMAGSVADIAPKSREIFWKRLLTAAKERNVAAHFEKDPMAAQTQMAEAEASLQ